MIKRVAVGALIAECNPQSPTATKEEFQQFGYFVGRELADQFCRSDRHIPMELRGFTEALRGIRTDIELIPTVSAYGDATGPIDGAFLMELYDDVCRPINDALPVDAVYLALHGSAKGEAEEDPEGELLERVRSIVGDETPIVATLDLHANISEKMARNSDSLIVYRTNPHVDMYERGAEAAKLINDMLNGMPTSVGFAKLPLIAPSPTHLTDQFPLNDVIALADKLTTFPTLNVSVATGFTHGDSPKSGMSICVTSAADQAQAQNIATVVASKLWSHRDDFVLDLITIDQAIARARLVNRNKSEPAIALADTCDNPGGGGRGNTVWLLSALYYAGICDCVVGGFFDPAVASQAHQEGEGARFYARFNQDEVDPLSGRFEAEAYVEKLHDGNCVGRKGTLQGQSISLGPTCLLRLGGVRVLVISQRVQCYDPVFFEMMGVDLSGVRVAALKSRGHFRAGFSEFFDDHQIFSVDSPGVTSRRLESVPFRNIRRPMYPLDKDVVWTPA